VGETAHFFGHDGETGAGFTSAGSFHSGVEREDIGLKRNLVDRLEDLCYLVAGGLDVSHCGVEGMHLLHIGGSGLPGLVRGLLHLLRGFGAAFSHRGNLEQGRTGFFKRAACSLAPVERDWLDDRISEAAALTCCEAEVRSFMTLASGRATMRRTTRQAIARGVSKRVRPLRLQWQAKNNARGRQDPAGASAQVRPEPSSSKKSSGS
jgi:hypothetical protein